MIRKEETKEVKVGRIGITNYFALQNHNPFKLSLMYNNPAHSISAKIVMGFGQVELVRQANLD